MMSQAKIISVAESNPIPAQTSATPSSLYKGKLEPLINKAKKPIVTWRDVLIYR